jgi:hypothetical protein
MLYLTIFGGLAIFVMAASIELAGLGTTGLVE